MAARKPLVNLSGTLAEIPSGDTLDGYAPASQGVTNGNSHDHSGGDGAQIAYSSLSGLPTLGTAAAAATTDFAAASHNQAETTITFTDVSTGNASTTAHGFAPKATAPASGLRSVLAIDNGETVRSDKALFDATNPAALGTASPGTAMTAARRDHVHALPSMQETLTANRTYYVRTDGSDSNTGLENTSGGAFLTVQKAIDVATSLFLGIYNITIQLGSGTFDNVIVLKEYASGGGMIKIEGSATPANHILTNTSGAYNGTVIIGESCGPYRFYGLRISVATNKYGGIQITGASKVSINNVDFTGGLYYHMKALSGAVFFCENGYSISGGVSAGRHIDVRTQGVFSGYGTITLTGTPDFDSSFVFADVGGAASFDGISFSGSATGSRYSARAGGIVVTFGGETYLPGNTAGSTSSGGIYA